MLFSVKSKFRIGSCLAVLLLLIVVLLNLTAIVVRTRLRRRYSSSAF